MKLILSLIVLFKFTELCIAAESLQRGCSHVGKELPICLSIDKKFAIHFYPTGAEMLDFYNGINGNLFCQQGYLKIKGQELNQSDFTVEDAVSNDLGLQITSPDHQTLLVQSAAKILPPKGKFRFENFSDLQAIQVYYLKNKTSQFFLLNTDGKTYTRVELTCF